MKRTIFALSAAFLFLVLTAGDCKKSTNEPTGSAPTPPSITFSSPGTQDICSQQAAGLVSAANGNTSMLAIFASLSPANNGNDYTWTIPLDSLTVTVKATRQSDGSFTWEVKYNGVQDGVAYTNKVILSGTTSSDGKSGNMTAYNDTSTAVLGTFAWSTSGDIVTGTLIENDNTQTQAYKMVLTTNMTSKAGEITTYTWSGSAWVQEFHATWTSQGGQATCS